VASMAGRPEPMGTAAPTSGHLAAAEAPSPGPEAVVAATMPGPAEAG
jgi:hypothetical protein